MSYTNLEDFDSPTFYDEPEPQFENVKVNLEGLLMMTALVTMRNEKVHCVSLYMDHACTRCVCDDADRMLDASQWDALMAGVAHVAHDRRERKHALKLIKDWQQSIKAVEGT